MADRDLDEWLYHLPAFLERVEERGSHAVSEALEPQIGGVLYHHRGVRLPAYDATFTWRGDRFDLELDAVGDRRAWMAFDADRSWDFYLRRLAGDEPCLVWMTDGEFHAEEADRFQDKRSAVANDRFSFGLFLHGPGTWKAIETRARETDAPLFVHRPDGRTYAPPEGDREAYAEMLPKELQADPADPPQYLGVIAAEVDSG